MSCFRICKMNVVIQKSKKLKYDNDKKYKKIIILVE